GIAVGGPGDVHDAVDERQGRALILVERIEDDLVIGGVIADSGNGCADVDGAEGSFRAGGDIEGVDALYEISVKLLRAREKVNCAGGGIDDRRADDAEIAADVRKAGAAAIVREIRDVRIVRRDNVGVGKTCAPIEIVAAGIVGIKSVDRVIHRGDDQQVMGAFSRACDVGHDERLRVNLIIDRPGVKEAEGIRVDVGNVENRFGKIGAGARKVIVLSENRNVSPDGNNSRQQDQHKPGTNTKMAHHSKNGQRDQRSVPGPPYIRKSFSKNQVL